MEGSTYGEGALIPALIEVHAGDGCKLLLILATYLFFHLGIAFEGITRDHQVRSGAAHRTQAFVFGLESDTLILATPSPNARQTECMVTIEEAKLAVFRYRLLQANTATHVLALPHPLLNPLPPHTLLLVYSVFHFISGMNGILLATRTLRTVDITASVAKATHASQMIPAERGVRIRYQLHTHITYLQSGVFFGILLGWYEDVAATCAETAAATMVSSFSLGSDPLSSQGMPSAFAE